MKIHEWCHDLSIHPDVLAQICAGGSIARNQVEHVLRERGITCEPYIDMLTMIGPIQYGTEDIYFDLNRAMESTRIDINYGNEVLLHGSAHWLCIAWQAVGHYFYIRDSDPRFPEGTVFMTTPERPLKSALIAASSPIALARLMAKDFEWFVQYAAWEFKEGSVVLAEPLSAWPFPSKETGKEPAFRIDPGLRELDARYPELSCLHELRVE